MGTNRDIPGLPRHVVFVLKRTSPSQTRSGDFDQKMPLSIFL